MTERAPVSPSSEASAPTATRTNTYSTFELGGEVYGLEFLKLQEIIGMMDVTSVPRTPDLVRGVINLNGKVDQKVVTMVNIDRVLSGEEIGPLEKGA